ncbi:tol-pal system YbgF family protein [uncultured Hymenobacter sp.]|uniref:tetratricopeptide repeat protein n=1 Tax=uncultured Hymenobacter sp. TaxID=170016 RepID=UPI0035C9FB75
MLKLKIPPARQLLRAEPATAPGTLLVADCADFAELIISQDAARYEPVISAQNARLNTLEKAPPGALRDYARAEIRLHQAVLQVAFGHEVVGALNFRQAFQQVQAVATSYPDFVPARKTYGLLQFGIGSLPDGYGWFLRLLGLGGNVEAGLRNITLAAGRPQDFQTESRIFLALIRETYYKRDQEAATLIEALRREQPDNLLFSFLTISYFRRQHHADAALAAFRARPGGPAYLPVPYLCHLAADLLLYQGQYAASETENQRFLAEYKGRHYRKDAAFKLYLAAWLGGAPAARTAAYRRQIAQDGPTDVEEDAYAQRFGRDALPLHRVLTRARLQIDGGYYRLALNTLRGFQRLNSLPPRDVIEEPYRRARAYHGLGRLDSARLAYERTLAVAGNAPYYFAPQAALQLGYLAQAAGQPARARQYFETVLHSPRHEYKNSTDAKAKVALRGLK